MGAVKPKLPIERADPPGAEGAAVKRTGWSRESFARAFAQGFEIETNGWVYRDGGPPLWGLCREGAVWSLTHVPTGLLVPGGFRRLRDSKRFVEELSAAANCAVGRFGVLEGRGTRAFRKAVSRRCALYGFNPVGPVSDRVVYDDKGASQFYPEPREKAGAR